LTPQNIESDAVEQAPWLLKPGKATELARRGVFGPRTGAREEGAGAEHTHTDVEMVEAFSGALEDGRAAGARAEASEAAGHEQVNRRAMASEHAAMAKQLRDLQKQVDAQKTRETEFALHQKERDEKHRLQAEEQALELRQLRDERRDAGRSKDERERMARTTRRGTGRQSCEGWWEVQ
jgi:hypothetical protein